MTATSGTPHEASDVVERVAQAIYDTMRAYDDEGARYPWVPGGNSHNQDEARRRARAALGDIAEAERERDAAREDAARYAWLRRRLFCDGKSLGVFSLTDVSTRGEWVSTQADAPDVERTDDELRRVDEFIDAARPATEVDRA